MELGAGWAHWARSRGRRGQAWALDAGACGWRADGSGRAAGAGRAWARGRRGAAAGGARGRLGVAWALEGGRLGQLGQFWCTVHLAQFWLGYWTRFDSVFS